MYTVCCNSKLSYSFWVGVHVTVGKELMKDDSKTPDIRFVGELGLTDGLWSVPAKDKKRVQEFNTYNPSISGFL